MCAFEEGNRNGMRPSFQNSLLHSLLVDAKCFYNMSQTVNTLQIIQLTRSNSSADLDSHNTVYELLVTLVMFLERLCTKSFW